MKCVLIVVYVVVTVITSFFCGWYAAKHREPYWVALTCSETIWGWLSIIYLAELAKL